MFLAVSEVRVAKASVVAVQWQSSLHRAPLTSLTAVYCAHNDNDMPIMCIPPFQHALSHVDAFTAEGDFRRLEPPMNVQTRDNSAAYPRTEGSRGEDTSG